MSVIGTIVESFPIKNSQGTVLSGLDVSLRESANLTNIFNCTEINSSGFYAVDVTTENEKVYTLYNNSTGLPYKIDDSENMEYIVRQSGYEESILGYPVAITTPVDGETLQFSGTDIINEETYAKVNLVDEFPAVANEGELYALNSDKQDVREVTNIEYVKIFSQESDGSETTLRHVDSQDKVNAVFSFKLFMPSRLGVFQECRLTWEDGISGTYYIAVGGEGKILDDGSVVVGSGAYPEDQEFLLSFVKTDSEVKIYVDAVLKYTATLTIDHHKLKDIKLFCGLDSPIIFLDDLINFDNLDNNPITQMDLDGEVYDDISGYDLFIWNGAYSTDIKSITYENIKALAKVNLVDSFPDIVSEGEIYALNSDKQDIRETIKNSNNFKFEFNSALQTNYEFQDINNTTNFTYEIRFTPSPTSRLVALNFEDDPAFATKWVYLSTIFAPNEIYFNTHLGNSSIGSYVDSVEVKLKIVKTGNVFTVYKDDILIHTDDLGVEAPHTPNAVVILGDVGEKFYLGGDFESASFKNEAGTVLLEGEILDQIIVGTLIFQKQTSTDHLLYQGNDVVFKNLKTTGDLVAYDNTVSGLAADNMKDAADELSPKYSEISVLANTEAIDLTIQNTWYHFVYFDTDGLSNDVVPDHTNDHLTIVTAGKYMVNFSAAITGSVSGTYEIQLFLNDGVTPKINVHTERAMGAAADIGSVHASGIVELTIDDTVEIWVRSTNAPANNITLRDATLSIFYLGI